MTNGNTVWMAAAANVATTLSIFMSFMYLVRFYRITRTERAKELKETVNYKYQNVKSIVKKILSVSIPMSLSSIMSSFNKNIDSFTVVSGLKKFMTESDAKAQYGILGGKVDTLTSLPLSINIAFATALVPTISIGLPCTIGMIVFADPILHLLYPAQPEGALLLQISSLTIIFTILDQTINGTLQGIGKVMVPAISLGCGMLAKLVINLLLVSNPSFGANGAAIGSVVCHMVAFSIAFTTLRRIMSICSLFIYNVLLGIISQALATLIAIIFAVVIYAISVVVLKILSKEEFFMIPYGQKIYQLLEKLGIYR